MTKDKGSLSRKSLIDDLERGLDIEKRSLVLSRELLAMAETEREQEVFSIIARDEKRHIKIVKKLIKLARD